MLYRIYRIIKYLGSGFAQFFSSLGKDQIIHVPAGLNQVVRSWACFLVTTVTIVAASDMSDVILLVFIETVWNAVTFPSLPCCSSFFFVNPQLERLMPCHDCHYSINRISLTLWPSVSFQRHSDGFRWFSQALVIGDLPFSYYDKTPGID